MRPSILLSPLILVALGAPAFAQPALSTPSEDAAPAAVIVLTAEQAKPWPRSYVSVDLTAGEYDGLFVGGVTFDLGTQYKDSALWFHGALGGGGAGELFADGSGHFLRVSAGPELRGCSLDGRICAFGGVDLGYLHGDFSGHDDLFGEGAAEMATVDQLALIPRIGLDVGNRGARLRVALDVPLDAMGSATGTPAGGGVLPNAGLAFRW